MGERGERGERDSVRIIIREIMRVVISIIPWNNCN